MHLSRSLTNSTLSQVSKISAEIQANNCSTAWSLLLGNELYNRSVVYVNPLFERLFKPIMEEKTKKDRIEGSLMILKSMKAQIGALLISINQDYLNLINIKIFDEVIYKYMDPSSYQFAVIALVRAGMVYGKKSYGNYSSSKNYGFLLKNKTGKSRKKTMKKGSLSTYKNLAMCSWMKRFATR